MAGGGAAAIPAGRGAAPGRLAADDAEAAADAGVALPRGIVTSAAGRW